MKISIADCDKKFYPLLKEIGFCGVDVPFTSYKNRDLILSDEYTESVMSKYKAVTDAGLKVCQTHLSYFPSHGEPIGSGTYEEYEEYMLPILEKEIMLVSQMGCRRAVLHPYFADNLENSRRGNVSLISKLLPTLEKYDVILCIEIIYGPKYGEAFVSTAEDLKYYTDHFSSPYVGICLDTGHSIIRGQDPLEMLGTLGRAVKAFHLHTTMPGMDLHAVPYSTSYYDRVKWDEFYALMCELGFDGTFNMEVRPTPKMGDAAMAAYFRYAYDTAYGIINK